MKLYRSKVSVIAKDIVEQLTANGDVEVASDKRAEAEKDLVAIMEEFLRRDSDFRGQIKDHMARRNIPYDEYGRTRRQLAEDSNHPQGDDVERFLARQFIENMLISPFIEEVYAEDKDLYKKVMEVLRSHDVDEAAIREEAVGKIKNVAEGTVEYEIALQNAIKDVKKRRGLIGPKGE